MKGKSTAWTLQDDLYYDLTLATAKGSWDSFVILYDTSMPERLLPLSMFSSEVKRSIDFDRMHCLPAVEERRWPTTST